MNIGYVLIGLAVLAFFFALAALAGVLVYRLTHDRNAAGRSISRPLLPMREPVLPFTFEQLLDDFDRKVLEADARQAHLARLKERLGSPPKA